MEGRSHRALAPIASHGSAELLSDSNYFMEAEEGDEDVMVGGCSVSPVRSSDLDRVSNTSSNSKSRESLTSTTSRSTMSSVDQQHQQQQQQHHQRPRSATTVSSTSSHFLRPKSLAISSGLVKIWRKERSRPGNHNSGNADIAGTSCPTGSRPTVRRKSDRKSVPLIRYDFVSAPSTPNSETDTLWMDSKHSVSTEVIPEIEKRSKRSGSRLSLNITSTNSSDKSRNPSPNSNSRSPKLISRFLRSSFARIMSFRGSGTQEGEEEEGGDTARTPQSEGAGLPGEGFVRRKQGYEELCSPEFKGHYPCTPSTQAYIEETRLSGLPVIPFAYPTCVIVERMKNATRDRVRQASGEYPSAQTPTIVKAGTTLPYDYEDGYFFDPAAHSPLENLVDIAQQELTEEETLFGLYDDSSSIHHNNAEGSIGTGAGSVGSACSAFDFYYNGCELNNRAPFNNKKSNSVSNNNNNNNITKPISQGLDCYSMDFFMEDELNLSDPTKSSWRRDLVPITSGGPTLGQSRTGPYLDMSYNHGTPKHGRSKAVPIVSGSFTVAEDSRPRLTQYSSSEFSKHK